MAALLVSDGSAWRSCNKRAWSRMLSPTRSRLNRPQPAACRALHSPIDALQRRARSQQLPLPAAARLTSPPSRRRRAQRAALRPQAGLYSLPGDLYGSLQTGCGIAYLLALCFSALPILTGDSLERNKRRYESPDTDESAGALGSGSHCFAELGQLHPGRVAGWALPPLVPQPTACPESERPRATAPSTATLCGLDSGAENIRWSVMGVLSVLPFINPMVCACFHSQPPHTRCHTMCSTPAAAAHRAAARRQQQRRPARATGACETSHACALARPVAARRLGCLPSSRSSLPCCRPHPAAVCRRGCLQRWMTRRRLRSTTPSPSSTRCLTWPTASSSTPSPCSPSSSALCTSRCGPQRPGPGHGAGAGAGGMEGRRAGALRLALRPLMPTVRPLPRPGSHPSHFFPPFALPSRYPKCNSLPPRS